MLLVLHGVGTPGTRASSRATSASWHSAMVELFMTDVVGMPAEGERLVRPDQGARGLRVLVCPAHLPLRCYRRLICRL